MLGSLVAAAAVQRFAGDAVIAMLIVGYFAAGVVALISPACPAPPPAAEKFGLRKAFADPVLRRALIAGTLTLGAHGVFYTFGTLYWQSQGLRRRPHRNAVGLQCRGRGHHLRSGEESRCRSWGARRFILAGAIAALIRWSLFPFATAPAAAFALQTLHGASFGLTHLGIMMAIGAVSTPGHTARLQAAYQFCHGSMMALTMIAAGPLFRMSPVIGFHCRGARLASLDLDRQPAAARPSAPERRLGRGDRAHPNRRGPARGPWREAAARRGLRCRLAAQ